MSLFYDLALAREEEIRHGVSTPARLAFYEQRFRARARREGLARRVRRLVTPGRRRADLASPVHVTR